VNTPTVSIAIVSKHGHSKHGHSKHGHIVGTGLVGTGLVGTGLLELGGMVLHDVSEEEEVECAAALCVATSLHLPHLRDAPHQAGHVCIPPRLPYRHGHAALPCCVAPWSV
jgi:hypothetical protein